MKKYSKVKYANLNTVDGVRVWENPEVIQEGLSLDDRHADNINAQFVNTGIMLVEEIKGTEETAEVAPVAGEQIGAGEPAAEPVADAKDNADITEAPAVVESPENGPADETNTADNQEGRV